MTESSDVQPSVNNEEKIRATPLSEEKKLELELREEKAETQRRMAWTAMISMIIVAILLFLPVFKDSRVDALSDLLGLFFIAMAGVVGAYMGTQAWINRR